MKIAFVGYGKMGHMMEQCAKKAGHEVVATIDVFAEDASVKVANGDTDAIVRAIKSSGAEGVIEFTHPSAVVENIKAILPLGLPLVVGTTGWNDKYTEIDAYAAKVGGTIMTAGNFSIGVNMFYKIVEEAAKIMSEYQDYDVSTWEMHHNQKADSPSGTALEIARRVMNGNPRKTEIVTDAFHERPAANQLHVSSTRCGNVPGTHKVFFDGTADTIELTHTARSREGFAVGAVESLVKLDSALKSGKLTKGKLYGWSDLF
ncbi:MAG: 4-hydroxy-tetrahydrodipicolinate reductase [Treponema sp.]|nr:4-hydroxy-tetrahydrodipicolinate reductase [Treponema sp.]